MPGKLKTIKQQYQALRTIRGWQTIFVFLYSNFIFSQTPAYTFPLCPQAAKILVDSLASQITKYYVNKEASLEMSATLKKQHKEGRYKNIKDPHTLAGLLTSDIVSVCHDEHFHVEYNPLLVNEISGNIDDVPKMVAEKLSLEKAKNFGFKKAEILNGNIGYLEISSFSRLNKYSKATADAALELLSHTRALIIDLRYGSGGSPEMVNHIISHFFKDKTHVADIYIRNENITLPYWTSPDSSYSALTEIPIFILTSYKTFSAAEGLTYELQCLKRATIVGEVTRGGAHTVIYRPLSSGFVADIPFGNATSPVTKSNWERTGINPDINVSADKALETAELKIFENAIAIARDSLEIKSLRWHFGILQSINHPMQPDTEELIRFSGSYGPCLLSFEKGNLYYQKTGKPKFQLLPTTANTMRAKGNDTFIVQFSKNDSGKTTRIATCYEDGRVEYAERNEPEK